MVDLSCSQGFFGHGGQYFVLTSTCSNITGFSGKFQDIVSTFIHENATKWSLIYTKSNMLAIRITANIPTEYELDPGKHDYLSVFTNYTHEKTAFSLKMLQMELRISPK